MKPFLSTTRGTPLSAFACFSVCLMHVMLAMVWYHMYFVRCALNVSVAGTNPAQPFLPSKHKTPTTTNKKFGMVALLISVILWGAVAACSVI